MKSSSDSEIKEQNKNSPSKKKLTDAEKVAIRIEGFDENQSDAIQTFYKKFGKGISRPELLKIANYISQKLGLTVDRDAKRDERVLKKWFDENWTEIKPLLDKIHLYDFDIKEIRGKKE